MGVRINVQGYGFEAIDFGVSESSTPLSGGDTSGSVGEFDFTIAAPDYDLPGTLAGPMIYPGSTTFPSSTTYTASMVYQLAAWRMLTTYGPEFFVGRSVTLEDSRLGFTVGKINSYRQAENGNITFSCTSRLGDLNIYGVQAQPYVGTLGGAFTYYMSLAGITTDLFVDPAVASRSVVYPGWNGELWYHLKMIAAAQDCEISLVSGIILLRSIREREAAQGRSISLGRTAPAPQLARSVEVYRYGNRQITGQLIYPPNGWKPGFEIITANAGETITQTLQLSASVTAIAQPNPTSFVVEDYSASSVYTIVADNDDIINPTDWARWGGYVSVVINPDTTSLTLTMGTPFNLTRADGSAYRTFSLAMPGGAGGSAGQRYSSLRIVGTGVAYEKVKEVVRTGVPDSATATQVGTTIDNPYVNTWEDVARVGTRAALRYAGELLEVSANVISINKRGDTGDASLPSYGDVEASLKSAISPSATYGQVQTYYLTTRGLPTYGAVQDYWFSTVRSDFNNQAFGNTAGARFYDRRTRRWYRIRRGDLNHDSITIDAEDDLTYQDMLDKYSTMSYGQVQTIFGPFDYRKAYQMGLLDG